MVGGIDDDAAVASVTGFNTCAIHPIIRAYLFFSKVDRLFTVVGIELEPS
jgi:hypothetical protein